MRYHSLLKHEKEADFHWILWQIINENCNSWYVLRFSCSSRQHPEVFTMYELDVWKQRQRNICVLDDTTTALCWLCTARNTILVSASMCVAFSFIKSVVGLENLPEVPLLIQLQQICKASFILCKWQKMCIALLERSITTFYKSLTFWFAYQFCTLRSQCFRNYGFSQWHI